MTICEKLHYQFIAMQIKSIVLSLSVVGFAFAANESNASNASNVTNTTSTSSPAGDAVRVGAGMVGAIAAAGIALLI